MKTRDKNGDSQCLGTAATDTRRDLPLTRGCGVTECTAHRHCCEKDKSRDVFFFLRNQSHINIPFCKLTFKFLHLWQKTEWDQTGHLCQNVTTLDNLLMPLQEQRSSFAASDVPHNDTVVGGPWEEQPLDWVPPQRCYTTWMQKKTDSLHVFPSSVRSSMGYRIMVRSAGSTQCLLGETQPVLSNTLQHDSLNDSSYNWIILSNNHALPL